jgi:pimeloyl-ACP methyl ester carboxylesterase
MMTLADGRHLAYIRSPEPGRRRVLFCHGTPGSRLFHPPDPTLPASLGLDLVTVDRPGYGQSTHQPGRRLLDWPADLAALADHLGWSDFTVAGISGGGPFALACAHELTDRVTAVVLVSSVAPYWPGAVRGMLATTRRSFQLAGLSPWLLRVLARRTARHPDRFLSELEREVPEVDRRIVTRPDVARLITANAEAALTGDEAACEIILLRRDWGFSLAHIQPTVTLWHGQTDRNVPVSHGRRLAGALPHCRLTVVPGAGHYMIFDRWAEILDGRASE